MHYFKMGLFALLLLLVPVHVFAGIKAVPIKIYLDARTKTTVLKVSNDGEDKVTVQLEAFEWKQDKDGKDIYLPTKELVFFPKIVDIEKGVEKIIRVGYESKKQDAVEKTYRLFLQELPVSRLGEVAVKMAIRMGLPVFIKAAKEVHAREIESIELSKGSLNLRVRNKGNSHFIVSKILVKGFDEAGAETFTRETSGWYVLAGNAGSYTVVISRDECLKSSTIKAQIEVDKILIDKKIDMARTMCADENGSTNEKHDEIPRRMSSSDIR